MDDIQTDANSFIIFFSLFLCYQKYMFCSSLNVSYLPKKPSHDKTSRQQIQSILSFLDRIKQDYSPKYMMKTTYDNIYQASNIQQPVFLPVSYSL
jgi:hypothetical protein